jgi:hypothetical protein
MRNKRGPTDRKMESARRIERSSGMRRIVQAAAHSAVSTRCTVCRRDTPRRPLQTAGNGALPTQRCNRHRRRRFHSSLSDCTRPRCRCSPYPSCSWSDICSFAGRRLVRRRSSPSRCRRRSSGLRRHKRGVRPGIADPKYTPRTGPKTHRNAATASRSRRRPRTFRA